jgi:GNAT superfamily N-acetyltransferase
MELRFQLFGVLARQNLGSPNNRLCCRGERRQRESCTATRINEADGGFGQGMTLTRLILGEGPAATFTRWLILATKPPEPTSRDHPMIDIRQARSSDMDALYRISLETGHYGENASHLYADLQMMGHIYSAPYLLFEPDLTFVVVCDDQVVGFCVGTSDTAQFEARLDADWWPSLRKQYPKPNENMRSTWSADERRCQMIHVPDTTPRQVVEMYPTHVHMNLLPLIQGQRLGGLILQRWMQQAVQSGVTAVHIGANANNKRALQFWRKQGFEGMAHPISRTVWMGRQLLPQNGK